VEGGRRLAKRPLCPWRRAGRIRPSHHTLANVRRVLPPALLQSRNWVSSATGSHSNQRQPAAAGRGMDDAGEDGGRSDCSGSPTEVPERSGNYRP
jgi:hypothetical protein